jgi:hypothetical protein
MGPKVESERFDDLPTALAAMEERMRPTSGQVRTQSRSFMGREFTPAEQVAARAELKGPRGLRAGLDMRGDGSAEAWTGRLSKSIVELRDGEDAYAALRRVTIG